MSVVGSKLAGILKGSASVSFSDGERDSGLISQDLQEGGRKDHACVCVQACMCASVHVCGTGNCGPMKEMK